MEDGVVNFYNKQSTLVKLAFAIAFAILYVIYFGFAIDYDFDKARNLIYITAFAVFCFIYWLVKKYFGRTIWKHVLKPIRLAILSIWKYVKW